MISLCIKTILFFGVLFTSALPVHLLADDLSTLVELKEWEVSWGGRPRDPFVDASGNVWFCGQAGNYIGRYEPSSDQFTKFQVPPGSHPHNLIVDSRGDVWYAGNKNAHIGKLDPATGKISQFVMPDGINDPHTLVFDQNENIWFTAQHSNAIGHLNTKTGEVRFAKSGTRGSRPYGIKVDDHYRPWVVMVGTNKLATVDPATFELLEIDLPRKDARPRRLEITQDNNVWYVDYADGYLGRYDVSNDLFKEWEMPGGSKSRPYGTALDTSQRLWIVETGQYPNNLVGFDTNTESFLGSAEIESGGSVRHMYFDSNSDSFWFGVDSGFIGRGSILKSGQE